MKNKKSLVHTDQSVQQMWRLAMEDGRVSGKVDVSVSVYSVLYDAVI